MGRVTLEARVAAVSVAKGSSSGGGGFVRRHPAPRENCVRRIVKQVLYDCVTIRGAMPNVCSNS